MNITNLDKMKDCLERYDSLTNIHDFLKKESSTFKIFGEDKDSVIELPLGYNRYLKSYLLQKVEEDIQSVISEMEVL